MVRSLNDIVAGSQHQVGGNSKGRSNRFGISVIATVQNKQSLFKVLVLVVLVALVLVLVLELVAHVPGHWRSHSQSGQFFKADSNECRGQQAAFVEECLADRGCHHVRVNTLPLHQPRLESCRVLKLFVTHVTACVCHCAQQHALRWRCMLAASVQWQWMLGLQWTLSCYIPVKMRMGTVGINKK